MRRLADGAYALVFRPPFGIEVASLSAPRTLRLEAEHTDEILALAHGVGDNVDPGDAFERLQRAGLADSLLPAVDGVVVRHLEQLGRPYQWQLPATPLATELVGLLRRANSQRKITFQEYGQTTCLPETGVARCWQLQRRAGRRKRILLVGDDDMLSVVLARMGHDVTLMDIDEHLLRFLARVASDEGLAIRTHHQDVRQPLPVEMVGAFDAVITDPMTFEPCLIAFLSRAAAALVDGGWLLCALHAAGRPIFQAVVSTLPLRVREVLYRFSAYHDEGFQESWYHSDLIAMQRVRGHMQYEGSDVIPFENLIIGAHGSRWHGCSWLQASPWRKPAFNSVVARLETWPQAAHRQLVAAKSWESKRWGHVMLVLDGGRQAAASYDKVRGALCVSLYPFVTEQEAVLRAHLKAVFPVAAEGCYRCELTPVGGPPLVHAAPVRAAREAPRVARARARP